MTFVNNNGKVPYIMVAGADHVTGEMPLETAEKIYNEGTKRASNRFPGYPVLLLSLVLLSSCSAKPETEIIELPELPVLEVTTPEPTPTVPLWSEEEVDVLAKMVWGEARGVPSDTEKAACVWCALNRVDQGYGSITTVITAPYQFIGYDADNPIDDEIKALCEDVLTRWYAEKDGETNTGRVLPSDYLWFSGDGKHNYFRNAYKGGETWDWSLPSPYET